MKCQDGFDIDLAIGMFKLIEVEHLVFVYVREGDAVFNIEMLRWMIKTYNFKEYYLYQKVHQIEEMERFASRLIVR